MLMEMGCSFTQQHRRMSQITEQGVSVLTASGLAWEEETHGRGEAGGREGSEWEEGRGCSVGGRRRHWAEGRGRGG